MPVFREHVRSSDSTDFERTSTLQDIEEMTHGEQEQTDSERHSSPATGSRPLSRLGGVTLSASTESRSQAVDPQPKCLSEKMLVFRDKCLSNDHVASDEHLSLFTLPAHQHRGNSMNIARHPCPEKEKIDANIFKETAFGPLRDGNHGFCAANARRTTTDSHHLLQQLHIIATTRSALLEQLAGLQNDEVEILAQLAQAIEQARVQTHLPGTNLPQSVTLPVRQTSPSKVPRLQPSRTSRQTLHARTLSAPTVSRMLGENARGALENVKRVPLSEKTDETTKPRDLTSHLRSRSEVIISPGETKQAYEPTRSEDVRRELVPRVNGPCEHVENAAIVSNEPQEMQFAARPRAQSASSVKSQTSTKSQGSIKRNGRSKSRDSTKGQGSVTSRVNNKSQDRKKSQSRSKSRGQDHAAVAVVQPPQVVEQAKRAKAAPKAHIEKKWEF